MGRFDWSWVYFCGLILGGLWGSSKAYYFGVEGVRFWAGDWLVFWSENGRGKEGVVMDEFREVKMGKESYEQGLKKIGKIVLKMGVGYGIKKEGNSSRKSENHRTYLLEKVAGKEGCNRCKTEAKRGQLFQKCCGRNSGQKKLNKKGFIAGILGPRMRREKVNKGS
ncbi:Uncharacterized protein Fot_19108 [Forsythia ovata]|uniref:Uncharacterized protein n=1 Tax=Forsythia ovata TaxID=205694 RepID=A0ABD1VK34_9LAMI